MHMQNLDSLSIVKAAPATLGKILLAIIAIVALTFGLSACGNSESSSGSKDAAATSRAADKKDEKQETGTSKVEKIVALDWRYEEILTALGVKPVGIVEIGKSKEPGTLAGKLTEITSVGQAKQPNLEIISSLEPDLILASPTRHAAIMDQLKEIAPTEAYSDATYQDVLKSMDEIAAKVGKEDEAKKVREDLKAKLEEAKKAVKPGTRAALAGWTKNTLYTWVDASFPASLLKDAGFEYGYEGEKSNIESKTDVAELTADKLPEMNLDVLFMYLDVDGFRETPFAQAVPTIVGVEQDVWSRARGPLAAEAMLDQIIETAK
ncbi:ABC transporter substrate-binding protein [Corynebacterium spheniscorum]|nr:iron-siderophore ABC transporter substrate-binding protein [Corynebacterium spheniscorum]